MDAGYMLAEDKSQEKQPIPEVVEALELLSRQISGIFRDLETRMNGSSRTAFLGYIKAIASGSEPFSLNSVLSNFSSGISITDTFVNSFAQDKEKKVVPDQPTLSSINRYLYQAYFNLCQTVPQDEAKVYLIKYLAEVAGGNEMFNTFVGYRNPSPIQYPKLEEL